MPRRFVSVAAIAGVCAVFLVAFAQKAEASSILLTFAGANLGCVPNGDPPTGCPESDGDQDTDYFVSGPNDGGGLVTVSNETDAFDDPYFMYFAQADASFGTLRAWATGSFDLPDPSYRSAIAGAIAVDRLTITAPGQSGQGTLNVSVLLDGLLQHTGDGGAAVFAAVSAGPDEDPFSQNNAAQFYDGTTPPAGPLTFSVDFEWGNPFYLSMILGTGVGTQLSCLACVDGDSDPQLVTGSGTATSDFFHTLMLTGLVPFASGNPILQDVQFSSDSGTQYSVNGVVPEPGSLLLLGTGLAALTIRRRRLG